MFIISCLMIIDV